VSRIWGTCQSLLRDHIAFSISKTTPSSQFRVEYSDSTVKSIVYTENVCYIKYPWKLMNNGETLLYAAYPFLEAQRQVHSWLTAYSAAVSLDGRGILLLGKSGAGKTSVALDMCIRYKAKIIGNDLVILGIQKDGIYAKAGTKFFYLRYESIKRGLPDLLKYFPVNPEETWLCKKKINPDELLINKENSSVKIYSSFLVHVDNNLSSIYVKKDNNLATKLFLIENFSRYIRGSCINVLGGERFEELGFIPSYDQISFHAFRKDLANRIISGLNYISGPVNQITDYIVK